MSKLNTETQLPQTIVSGSRFVPMLFSTPMVQALLNGTKTETRRTQGLEKINENPDKFVYKGKSANINYHLFTNISEPKGVNDTESIKSKMNVGDIIWVRETFFDTTNFQATTLFNGKSTIIYKADETFIGCNKWKPSLYMSKNACRIFLKCISVHVERLQDIDEQSAINEGVEFSSEFGYKLYCQKDFFSTKLSASDSYMSLWEKINGKDSWKLNPFVWVYKFVNVDVPDDFR